MEIKGEDYYVSYDPDTGTCVFEGVLRLLEYHEIKRLMDHMAAAAHPMVTLDMRKLRFLNSYGINMFFGFVIKVREYGGRIIVMGSSRFPWQGRSLKDLKKLMPRLQLKWE